ncbi:MAG TPA: isoprenylcysteine carboxylmethyltransferase family protein [Myxococcota bacterium]|jgi:protein-S-isoprenylcysteine O-methyltransferase Ste14
MKTLLAITLAAQAILFLFTGLSWLAPAHRIWPPPSRQSWQLYTTWFLSWVSLSGVFLLAVFGRNSLGLPAWLRLGAGLPLLAAGIAAIAWGFRELSIQTTLGASGGLIRSGPYRWSRNPQYVGACCYLISLVLLSGSHLTAIGCLAVAAWFIVTPFVEEPWLAERFGDEYQEYRRSVPRFLG